VQNGDVVGLFGDVVGLFCHIGGVAERRLLYICLNVF